MKDIEDYLLCDVAQNTSVEHLDGKVEIMLLEQGITMKGPSQHKGANAEQLCCNILVARLCLPKAQRTRGIESFNFIEFFKPIDDSTWFCLAKGKNDIQQL